MWNDLQAKEDWGILKRFSEDEVGAIPVSSKLTSRYYYALIQAVKNIEDKLNAD